MIAPLFFLLAFTARPEVASLAAQDQTMVVALGESNTPEQVVELLGYFGADDDDTIVTVSLAETREVTRGIYDLSGINTAFSSSALSCRPEGTGLEVQTRNIEVVVPAMYAMALLTAGIDDASLLVAAPEADPALGMTALSGVFQTWDLAPCRSVVVEERRALAVQQLALTIEIEESLGSAVGIDQVVDLVLAVQEQVLTEQMNDEDAIAHVVADQESAAKLELPREERAALVRLMTGLVALDLDWGTFAAGWTLERDPGDGHVVVTGHAPRSEEVASGSPAPPRGVGGMVAGTTPAPTPSATSR
ncbi:MAG TPA: DUF1002 domain-containing protein, partial [Thermomicrobiales bacterium]|nr:DUF1002 domain-containing protein [Thermomicrobiales bacterium]